VPCRRLDGLRRCLGRPGQTDMPSMRCLLPVSAAPALLPSIPFWRLETDFRAGDQGIYLLQRACCESLASGRSRFPTLWPSSREAGQNSLFPLAGSELRLTWIGEIFKAADGNPRHACAATNQFSQAIWRSAQPAPIISMFHHRHMPVIDPDQHRQAPGACRHARRNACAALPAVPTVAEQGPPGSGG
jgi:hypothetical protein